jgi:hypothetical protein
MTRSKTLTRLLSAAGAAILALVLLAPAAQATEPEVGYQQFAGCPDSVENPEIAICLTSVINSGHFQMGSKDVPISKPITLSGGLNESFGGFDTSPAGGLSPAQQEIPGGIIGLTGLDWLINFLKLEALKVYAVTELAGSPSNFSPTSVTLPIKVHLINPVLGNNCYVGSNSKPIVLNLITGTTEPPSPNKPITGQEPTLSVDSGSEIVSFSDGTFVDNSFAAPGANGCKLTLLGFLPVSLDGAVNLQSGLPSAAGRNETVQNFDIELAPPYRVYPTE